MFEFDGQLYDNEIDFLDILKQSWEHGDRDEVKNALDEYGFDISDLNAV